MGLENLFVKLQVRRFMLRQPEHTSSRNDLNAHLLATVPAKHAGEAINECVLEGLISFSQGGSCLHWHEEVIGLMEVLHG
jgi:hypothetical protein